MAESKSSVDAFLELKVAGNNLTGEIYDKQFKGKAFAILDFWMGAANESSSGSADSGLDDGDDDAEDDAGTDSTSKLKKAGTDKAKKKKKGPPKNPLEFQVTKDYDTASPFLFRCYCMYADQEKEEEEPIDSAKITLRRPGPKGPTAYLVVEFSEVQVTSYQMETEDTGSAFDKINFSAKKVTFTYTPMKHGAAGAGSPKTVNCEFFKGNA